jgi:hypothetical protein
MGARRRVRPAGTTAPAHQSGVGPDGQGHRDDGHHPEWQRIVGAAESDERRRDAAERNRASPSSEDAVPAMCGYSVSASDVAGGVVTATPLYLTRGALAALAVA